MRRTANVLPFINAVRRKRSRSASVRCRLLCGRIKIVFGVVFDVPSIDVSFVGVVVDVPAVQRRRLALVEARLAVEAAADVVVGVAHPRRRG